MSSFTQKILKTTFVLAQGGFGVDKNGDPLGNTKIITDLRTSCTIEKTGHPSKNKMKLEIYGMLEQDMNTLTVLAFKHALGVGKNLVRVEAGDVNGLAVAFAGDITSAYASYKSPPNLEFHVEALAGYFPAIAPSDPRSFKGSIDVKTVMGSLAKSMEYVFEDNGVSIQLANPYFSGTDFQQASNIAEAANIEFGVDDGVLWIAPRGKERGTHVSTVVSPSTGLIEYPVFDKKGIKFSCLYNPTIVHGGIVVVADSAIKKANGIWRVVSLKHHLEALKPNGKWQSEVKATWLTAPSTTGEGDAADE